MRHGHNTNHSNLEYATLFNLLDNYIPLVLSIYSITFKVNNFQIFQGCFHSFHIECLNGATGCPLCLEFLKGKVQELGHIAKNAILNPSKQGNDNDEEENDDQSDNNDESEDKQNLVKFLA